MKIIAIDVGNSETTIGVGNSQGWQGYRFTTRKTVTSDELLMMFKTIIDNPLIKEGLIEGAIICSVVPEITNSVSEATSRFISKDVLTVGPGVKTGLKVNIDNPKELGPDRIANSIGGYSKASSEVIVVDLGTATTFDIVNTNKGVRLKAYYEDDSDKKIPYPLIDISKWEMQKEIHWEEIFRSNVEVLITNLWREEYWGDVRRLEKNDIVIYVRFYADNRLVFYLESMG